MRKQRHWRKRHSSRTMCGKLVGRRKRPLHAYHKTCAACIDRALDAGYTLTVIPRLVPLDDSVNAFEWNFQPTKITIKKLAS